jgi:putative hydrolase of the HAD superfamily
MPNHNISYILFDLGYILIELNGMPWFKKNYPELSDIEIHRKWLSLDCVQQFETGEINEQHFFEQAVLALELSQSPEEFSQRYKHWVTGPYEGAQNFLKLLKNNYSIGCLSNTNACHINHLNQQSDFLSLFDHRFYSHEIGFIKPNPLAYHHVLKHINISPEQVLFIDDNPDNVRAANDIGMQALYAKGFRNVRRLIETKLNI